MSELVYVKKSDVIDRFVHLHTHSEYSALDGLCRISRGDLSIRGKEVRGETLPSRVKRMGMPAIALTDHGHLGGYYRFVHECEKVGVQPLVGIEFYVAEDRLLKSKETRFEEDHLVVIARSWEGLQALFRLVTDSFEKGFYQRPRTDLKSIVAEAGNGLICLSGCVSGRLARLTLGNKRREAKDYVDEMLNAFGGNFFVELQPHSFDRQVNHNLVAVDVARECGARIVATNDAHYLMADDWRAHEVMLCVQTGKRITDPDRFKFEGTGYHIRTRREMGAGLFAQGLEVDVIKEALDNTLVVAGLIDIKIPKLQGLVPSSGVDDKRGKLEEMCLEGFLKFVEVPLPLQAERMKIYEERWTRELNVIETMGYLDYFLIVAELYRWVEEQGIIRGPGRGSVGGSLVAYLIGITMVDPIVHGLDFERFINPARGKRPPDIDMDFQDDRRQEVIEWFRRRFGEQNVAHIGAWSTIQGKSAVRDVARAFGIPLSEVEEATGLVEGSIAESDLGEFEHRWPEAVQVMRELEDVVRQKGVHAAGIVASPRLREIMPIEVKRDKVVTALTGKEVEDAGLLKFDILGLAVLQAISITLEEIERNHGVRIDLRKIPLDDDGAFEKLSSGRTAGVFEFDTMTCSRECRKMTFEKFQDVVLMSALLRPGTMRSGTAELYYKRRRGEDGVPKVHPAFDRVTRETLGVVVFDEQVSALFREMAGFTPERADDARVVVAKSQGGEKFERFRAEYIEGAKGIGEPDEAKLNKIFDDLVSFSGYAFNRAHSTEYSMLAMWTAWFREHYPAEWWTGALSAEKTREKAGEYVHEAQMGGVTFLPPCVNASGFSYRTEGQAVRVGFMHVLGAGYKAAREIEAKQPFKGIDDFLERVDRRVVNKTVVEHLTLAGAMRSLEPNTRGLFEALPMLLDKRKRRVQAAAKGQVSLFDDGPTRRFDGAARWTAVEEGRERLLYVPLPIDGDPVDLYPDEFKRMSHVRWTDVADVYEPEGRRSSVFIRGLVTDAWTDDRHGRGLVLDCNVQDSTATARCRFRGDAFRTFVKGRQALVGSVAIFLAQPFRQSSMWFAEQVALMRDVVDAEARGVEWPALAGWLRDSMRTSAWASRPVDKGMGLGSYVGRLVSFRIVKTRSGKRMAFGTLLGAKRCVELVVWPDSLKAVRRRLVVGSVLICRGEKDEKGLKIDVKRGDSVRERPVVISSVESLV